MVFEFVDFHCHLDLYPDPEEAMAECVENGVYVLAVTTTPKAWPRNKEMTRGFKTVQAALGLHPQLVAERASEIDLWEEYLPQARYVGEVGLDAGPRYYRSFDQQRLVFKRMLRACARAGGKILSVHAVRAVTAVLDMIETDLPSTRGRVVLHWFSGNQTEAKRAVKLGCYFSINSEMLRKHRSLEMVAALPMDRLLTESDGPFIQCNDRPTKPNDIPIMVRELAKARRSKPSEIAGVIRRNLLELVSEERSWC